MNSSMYTAVDGDEENTFKHYYYHVSDEEALKSSFGNLDYFKVLGFVIKLEAVTVNPLCPTNKIAPHRRSVRGERRSARTIGSFYNLLVPDSQTNNPSHLQEEPQNESDDCGDIEDYDENDLSSLTTNPTRRHGRKGFFGNSIDTFLQQYIFNQNTKATTTTKPLIYKPTRPPTGGYFGTNAYRPQPVHQPSDYIKPVQEHGNEPYYTYNYRPNVVGALSGNIVGAVQVKPTRRVPPDSTAQKQNVHSNYAYPPSSLSNAHSSEKRPRYIGRDSGILHSFIDLIL